ncbi:hypothetical protein HPB50_027121 [Hyalomma asiaticum]|uniref:Uncharacterized protein n=1 Tax=Hyalomma asiaticum TaxID=266040 RepID=A0ACB7RKY0_HYAAI|nr:hypothetical protein HPB50_027121 [Hyalomma asiaticum]
MDMDAIEEPDPCHSPGALEIALDTTSGESSGCEAPPSPAVPSPVTPAPSSSANDNNDDSSTTLRKKRKKIGRKFAGSLSKNKNSASGADTAGGSSGAPRKRKSYSVTEKLALVAEVEAGRKKVS